MMMTIDDDPFENPYCRQMVHNLNPVYSYGMREISHPPGPDSYSARAALARARSVSNIHQPDYSPDLNDGNVSFPAFTVHNA